MDEIQRQLALIDKQLRGRWDFHTELAGTAPLIFVAVGLIIGIAIQYYLSLNVCRWLLSGFLFLAIGVVICFVINKRFPDRKWYVILIPFIALLCAVSLGGVRLISYKQARPDDIRNFVGDERILATIKGVIVTEPYANYSRGWAFKKYSHSDPTSSFYLKLTEAEAVGGWTKVNGKVRVQADEPILDLKAGDYVLVYCWLSRFKPATNPGQFDVADYLASRNVYVGASVKSSDGIKLLDKGGGSFLLTVRNYLYNYSNQALFSQAEMDNEKGLLKALLLGYRGGIDSDTYQAFRKTGLLHFISLSGMHLGILVGLVWWLCGRLGLLKPGRAVVCIIVIILFLLIVPPREPALRAAIICFVFCASAFFRRYPNSLNSLSLAAILLLLIRPTCLFEAGWQLSFACVLSILLFCPHCYQFMSQKVIPEAARKTKRPYLKVFVTISSFILAVLSTGFTAWLGGAGILLYHFYTINPLTCLLTVLVFPLIAISLTIGYLTIVLSLFFPSVSTVLAFLLNGLSAVLIRMVKLLSEVCPSEILIGKVPLYYVLFFYAAILMTGWLAFSRIQMKKLIMGFLILLVVVSLGFIKGQKVKQNELVMTVLDVGHGQAIVVQSSGSTLLFDTGSLHSRDIGRRVVVPFLRYSGIDKLNTVIISHDDIDHINGLPEVAQQYQVDNVFASKDFLERMETGVSGFLSKELNRYGLIISGFDKEKLANSFGFRILWPDENVCGDNSISDNDKSVVALIEYGEHKILICSDIEEFAQEQLLKRVDDLSADVVIVPHHGSVKNFDSDFLKRTKAEYLICSCGQRNYQRIRRRKIAAGDKLFITARDGAVSVIINSSSRIIVKSCCRTVSGPD